MNLESKMDQEMEKETIAPTGLAFRPREKFFSDPLPHPTVFLKHEIHSGEQPNLDIFLGSLGFYSLKEENENEIKNE
jgi:hypothetical protein